ncbi:MAG TPA: Ig-like domain-containing protein [Methanomicrobiales archaeon]|nr:Ig-like domain-containing protein [Methanomicrobiales archaeon]
MNLTSADGEVVGCVAVTNDNTYLYVTFTSSPSYQMRMANWSWGYSAISAVPASLMNSYSFRDGETTHAFPGVFIGDAVASDIASITLAAYATVEKKGGQTCSWVASDATETFSAYNNTALGPDVTGVPSYPKAPLRTGTAVLAYISPWHNPSLYFGTSKTPFAFTIGKWIWESYWVKDPWKGDVVDFTKTFNLAGTPVSGTLWITADDGYNFSLNGVPVGSEGLNNGWRTSNLKYAYVPGHGLWKSVEKYDLTKFLKQGSNTIYIQTANRYMGCDNYLPPGVTATDTDFASDGSSAITLGGSSVVSCGGSCAEPKGTLTTNIGALIYEAQICSSSTITKEAWVLDSTGAKSFAYRIKRVVLTFSPQDALLSLPLHETTQAMTVKAADRSVGIASAPLVLNTTFGAFDNGKQSESATTDGNGLAGFTITSTSPGKATILAWIDANGNGMPDSWEWSSTTTVEWLSPAAITLSDSAATVQLPDAPVTASATVLDQDGFPMEGVPVTFTIGFNDGTTTTTTQVTSVTDENGVAQAVVAENTAGTATVTAAYGTTVSAPATSSWLPVPVVVLAPAAPDPTPSPTPTDTPAVDTTTGTPTPDATPAQG